MTSRHTVIPGKISYDPKTVHRFRSFLKQVLILLDERRENPNKPKHYVDPTWDYENIIEALGILNEPPSQNLTLDLKTNKRLIEIYEMAQRHYYSRIMSMYYYYQKADEMIRSCNGARSSVGTNLLLAFGGPPKKVA